MRNTQSNLDSSEDTEIEATWAFEIERRIAEVESGEAETVSWEEARTRIRNILGTFAADQP